MTGLLFSLAILFISFNVANLFAATAVELLHAKWSLVIGGTVIALFHTGFFFLNRTYLYASSLLLGLASARECFCVRWIFFWYFDYSCHYSYT